jgi:carbon-monoxide dehydrogenase large subunit
MAWSSGDLPEGPEIALDLACARLAPMALEPRAALAVPEGGGLTLWLSTQAPHRARDDLARVLDVDPARLRVVAPDVGGAFGAKASIHPEEALVAEAARRLGRPVAWIADRSGEFSGGSHGRGARIAVRARLGRDGTIAGIAAALDFPVGAWTTFSAAIPAQNAARILPGPYAIPAVAVRAAVRAGASAPVGIYRGAGRPEAALVLERLMDLAARRAGADPIAFRRRHIRRGPFPQALPHDGILDSGDFAGLLDRLEAAGDYAAQRAEVAAARAAGRFEGIGVALYVEPCGRGGEMARAALTREGRIRIATGATAQGQGRETAFAAIAAEGLGLPAGMIDVVAGDTAAVAEGVGALASRSTAIGGSAVLEAATRLGAALRDAASAILGCAPAAVVLGGEGVAGPGGAPMGWAALAAALGSGSEGDEVIAEALSYEAPAEAWASGAVLARIAIERDTGLVTVPRLVWIEDAGRIVVPVLAEGQLVGGMAQGFGEAVMERLVYDAEGQLLTGSLMDYAVPRAADVPPVEIHHAPTATTANALGAKGVGEAGTVGAPAAILNGAIDALAALGIDHLDMPLTPCRVWTAIQEAGG